MALAPKTIYTYPLDGQTFKFPVNFEYLARKFVQITLVGKDRRQLVLNQDFRFATRTEIETTVAWGASNGYEFLEVRRFTSATERLVDFSDGSILRAYDLNISTVQSLHIAEEARDLTADTISVNNDGNLDARGRRLVNLADAVDPGDAVTLRQQQTWAGSALNSANKAEQSSQNSFAHAVESGKRMEISGQYAEISKGHADRAALSVDAAAFHASNSANSATRAEASADRAGTSATNAKVSEDAAKASAQQAGDAATAVRNKQDRSDVLDDLSKLTPAQNRLIMAIGVRGFAMKPITDLAQQLIAASTKEEMKSILGVTDYRSRLLVSEITDPATWDDGVIAGFKGKGTGKGNGNKANMFSFVVDEDQIEQTAGENGMTGTKVEGLGVRHKFGGGRTMGGRHAIGGLLHQIAPCHADSKDRNYVGVQGHVVTGTGDGGTVGNPLGAYFAVSGFAAVIEGAYEVMNVTAAEFNTYVAKGDGVRRRVNVRTGIQIADYIEERGYGLDTAVSIGGLGGAGHLGAKNGISFSGVHGGPALAADSIGINFFSSCSASKSIDGVINLEGVSTNYFVRSDYSYVGDTGASFGKPNATVFMGTTGTPSVVSLVARTGGLGANADFALTFSAGTSTAFGGVLQLSGDGVISPLIRPDGDGNRDIGLPNFRWRTPYFVNSPVTTSDARRKTPVRRLTFAEIEAAKSLSREIGVYQWLESITEKGEEDARLFLGLTVQRAMEILRAAGLNPFRYSFICYDKWDHTPAVYNTNQEGETVLVHPEVLAGDIYSFRKDELHYFIMAGLSARLEAAGF